MNIHDATEQAYKKGKADAAREIFAEIDKITNKFLDDSEYTSVDMMCDFAKLKKKYTEGNQ